MLQKIADAVRVLSAEAVENTGSGHPGMPMGCAEIGAYVFAKVLNYNPDQPNWFNRDRLFLSAGHGSMWLYSLLHLSGYDLSIDDLKNYRKFDSNTPSHPELGRTAGVEMTTGPLGQGFSHAVGSAAAEEMLSAEYNTEEYKLIDHYTYVIAGDGDLMEGVSYEAASLAGSLSLSKLIVIYDNNKVSIDGPTDDTFEEDIRKRFEAAGWQVIDQIDGSSFTDLKYAFSRAKKDKSKPTIIIADTIIGRGIESFEGDSSAHASSVNKDQINLMKENIGWPKNEFEVPDEIYQYFDQVKSRLEHKYDDWIKLEREYRAEHPDKSDKLDAALALEINDEVKDFEILFKDNKAPRDFSGEYFRYFADQISYIISGSADLTASTRLKLNKYRDINNGSFSGRSIKFGVREHAMAGFASGLMLHGGLRPIVSTYLTFSDYMRPTIRLAAMMELPVIYVFTHDSIYVGEDGPTHQPVEQIEALRLIPALRVIRPADEKEVRYAWRSILEEKDTPTALILARQKLPNLENETLSYAEFSKGAYILKDYSSESSESKPDISKKKVLIMASGSEVSTALKAAEQIENSAEVRVVSVPEKEKLYDKAEVVNKLAGDFDIAAAVEAGVKTGWYRLIPGEIMTFGIEDFGISGSGSRIADHFKLKADIIAEKILQKLNDL